MYSLIRRTHDPASEQSTLISDPLEKQNTELFDTRAYSDVKKEQNERHMKLRIEHEAKETLNTVQLLGERFLSACSRQ